MQQDTLNAVLDRTNHREAAKRILGPPIQIGRMYDKYMCPHGHDNGTPSFTAYADHYYCYGCQAWGRLPDLLAWENIISLTSQGWGKEVLKWLGEDNESNTLLRPYGAEHENRGQTLIQFNDVWEQDQARVELAQPYMEVRELWPAPLPVGYSFRWKKLGDEWISAGYVAIPHLWKGNVYGIKYRRDDTRFGEVRDKIFGFPEIIAEQQARREERGNAPLTDEEIVDYYFSRYRSVHGSTFGIYNADLLDEPHEVIVVTEGEFDCQMCLAHGVPAVSLKPKKERFNQKLAGLFEKQERVIVIGDGDKTGCLYGMTTASYIGNKAALVFPPKGNDVCESVYLGEADWLKKLPGVEHSTRSACFILVSS